MWLTGFDVPSLHTMYIDKPMRGHGLMQSIARVNRVFGKKQGGLVVDYIGIVANLQDALNDHTDKDKDTAGVDTDAAVSILLEKISFIRDMLHHHDYQLYFSGSKGGKLKTIVKTVNVVLGFDENDKKTFLQKVYKRNKYLGEKMSKIFNVLLTTLFLVSIAGCTLNLESTNESNTTFKPDFTNDASASICGDPTELPVIDGNSVQFGDASNSCGARVVSNQGYKNITQIRFTADLSNVSGNFVTNTFYMVNNPTNPSLQPIGNNYCDAGGNNASWNCQEVDFFEANKNVFFQHTMHIGDGSSNAPQNFQLSYSTTEDQCFQNLNPATALTFWNGIDIKQPVDFVVDLDENGMTITVNQGTVSAVVYKMGTGYSGSTTFNNDQIKRWQEGRAQGYWLNLSRWQSNSWSPGAPQGFYNWSCPYSNVCGATTPDYFKIYNIEVDAEGTL